MPAVAAPRWFFRWFPFGRGWFAATGAYNEHSILDLGFAEIAFGIVLVWAAVTLGRELCLAASVAAVVANVPHLMFHLAHTDELPIGDNIAQDGLLGLSTLVAVIVLGALLRRSRVPS